MTSFLHRLWNAAVAVRPRGRLLLICLLMAWSLPAMAQARVVVTIKPLQLIAAAITDGVSEPELLIPANQSYHHFTLRPSAMRTLTSSDLLLWVGPELETYLADAVYQLDRSGAVDVLPVSRLSDITRHSPLGKALISGDGEAHGHDHAYDPHLWLDTRNAERIAQALLERLVEKDPANAGAYQANTDRFTGQLQQWREEADQRMAALRDRDYAVYHNAFQYFEREHGLEPALVFVLDDEIQPGMRQLLSVRRELENRPMHCLLEDGTANAATIRTALGDLALRRVQADTMAVELSAGPDAYIQLLEQLVGAYEACLAD